MDCWSCVSFVLAAINGQLLQNIVFLWFFRNSIPCWCNVEIGTETLKEYKSAGERRGGRYGYGWFVHLGHWMKGCRWMTYHLTVHIIIMPTSKKMNKGRERDTHRGREREMGGAQLTRDVMWPCGTESSGSSSLKHRNQQQCAHNTRWTL